MEQVFDNVKEIEKKISAILSDDEKTSESIMIENAALALKKVVKKICSGTKSKITVLCGSGNNGADGYTLCRLLSGSCKINVVKITEPESFHCKQAFEKLVKIFQISSAPLSFYDLKLMQGSTSIEKVISKSDVVVDCIFGTGFHDLVNSDIQKLLSVVNNSKVCRIACDIPSGLDNTGKNISSLNLEEKKRFVFFADYTVSMGAPKTGLFSDCAKDVVGKLVTASIGVSRFVFNSVADSIENKNKIYLLEKSDLKKPVRKEENSHKGNFGHICVISGEKPGAAILCALSGLKSGAGLSSLLVNNSSDFEDFQIPPSLMTCNEIPAKAETFVIGPGFGRDKDFSKIMNMIKSRDGNNISIVFDADCFYYSELLDYISNSSSESRISKIVLTPHPKEFCNLLKMAGLGNYSVKDVCDNRIELVRKFCTRFPEIVLVLKGANTLISQNNRIYICNKGTVALAKAGSGDVLSGVIAGLLAQKYSSLDSAINGVLLHAIASRKVKENYSLTPELLIEKL